MVKRPQKNLFHLKDLCMDINLEENRNIVERFIQYKETGNKQVHVEINEGKVNWWIMSCLDEIKQIILNLRRNI
mgnify:CR=1 FL=1